ncbi:hypothetical protein IMZ48_42655 [Candidatus Bathyarchaeota archaeon]|nr:hypothetical protein [Candidatus Bathyarchaeota archaeon]
MLEPKAARDGGGWRAAGTLQAHAWTSVFPSAKMEVQLRAEIVNTQGKRIELDGWKLARSPLSEWRWNLGAMSGPSQSSFEQEVADSDSAGSQSQS